MSKLEWYRRTTWTERDREEFDVRLNRSRGAANKSQYLRIQAGHLAEAGLHIAAIELVDRMLVEFPEKTELGAAHLQKAESLASLGQHEQAIIEFRAALQAERDFRYSQTNAWLEFGWFVIENGLTDHYAEILCVFKEFRDDSGLTFPVIEYRYCTVRAIIAEFLGEPTAACAYARRALDEAGKKHSGLKYHAKVGLVGMQKKQIEKKLKALAQG